LKRHSLRFWLSALAAGASIPPCFSQRLSGGLSAARGARRNTV
jgi:hypothetical protein